ncbi:hypothetical protein [Mesorhizobium sp. B263B2A]|uniref:hypothetical protein n=1 Tax=Mesorhizobium sp. B263B2A TaxID=2876669 RepID=UPI001CD0709C|nr:hypothetical protein [Mesorhizobium sp. B263B2A]MCA0032752.1 hypothetical protein [Mesorhizobium sp. B263B2A]
MSVLDGSELVQVFKDGSPILVQLRDLSNRVRIIEHEGTSRKARSTDAGARLRMMSGSASSVIIPADTDGAAFDDGGAFEIEQGGAGQVTVIGAAGVTIDTAETLVTAKQFAVLYMVRVGVNHWHCSGYQVAA